jgi:hypothetical protein
VGLAVYKLRGGPLKEPKVPQRLPQAASFEHVRKNLSTSCVAASFSAAFCTSCSSVKHLSLPKREPLIVSLWQ